MKNRKAVIIGLAVGFMALVPVAASASTGTPKPTPGHGEVGPTTLSLSPQSGVPGDKVTITVACDGESSLITRALTVVKDRSRHDVYIGTVNSVYMGVYEVKEQCHHREGNYDTFATDYFGVGPVKTTPPPTTTTTPPVKTSPVKTPPSKASAAKQVAKVPAGAPSTGGGGMAGDLG
jgi:hypothetical protein